MSTNIVLIRGLFRGKFHWGSFTEDLQAAFPDRDIICGDIPGTGELCSLKSPTSIEAMVESIRGQRSGSAKVDIVSISMGGMIALKWAELYPAEVQSIVCINTSAKEFSPFYQRLLPSNYARILVALFSPSHEKETIVYGLVSNKAIDDSVISHWVSINERYPMRPENFFRQLLAALKFRISKIDCKMLFISSAKDNLVSHKATTAIAKAWDAPVIINLEDGHDIALDNPQWLCNQLGRWLQKERG